MSFRTRSFPSQGSLCFETPELHPETAPEDINRFDREEAPRVISSLEDYQRLEAKDNPLVRVTPALLPWQYSYVAGIVSSLLGFGLLFLGLRFVNEAQEWMDPQSPASSDSL